MKNRNYAENPDQKINWKVFRAISPYLFKYRLRIAAAVGCLVLSKGASVSGPFILKNVVDSLTDKGIAEVILIPTALIFAYGFARFSMLVMGEIRDTIFGRVCERAMRKIGLEVFQHMHHLDLEFHLNRRTGGLSRDIDRGINGISFLMRFFVFNIVPTLLEIMLVAGLLLYNYGISFALVTIMAAALFVLFSMITTDWRTQFVRDAAQADSRAGTVCVESLLNHETVKYFTNEDYESKRYDQALKEWEQAKRKERLSLLALNTGQAFIISVAMAIMLWLAAGDVRYGVMTIGDFVLINAFMMQLFMPLNFLGFVYREIRGATANIENMFSLMGMTSNVLEQPNAPDLKISGGDIVFKDVSFAYHDERSILKCVDLTIGGGQQVAIVGASGAGKSTLVKLLFRSYDTLGGSILVDGQNIASVSLRSLRESIGIVPQDTVLFNDSIFENIRYGNPAASDNQVLEAIKLAYLEDFIKELPDGFDTVVGERGLKLSGGEKQRVTIARTILKKPAILVFDEATSSLDSESERSIMEALNEISRGHTSLIIAHRLSTIINADKIIVMDHGEIVEQGSHSELLEVGNKYADLWTAQLREKD
ncbi:MAG: metal ABC transporter permease [Porticoccaceae bacterium]|nr:metal ABC transporter permease [Porticoccaceae bacterium]|tara:strand:+ start:12838 stop:14622 length:1785 start_codon:yes stop_codon:yes gene_type:complete